MVGAAEKTTRRATESLYWVKRGNWYILRQDELNFTSITRQRAEASRRGRGCLGWEFEAEK